MKFELLLSLGTFKPEIESTRGQLRFLLKDKPTEELEQELKGELQKQLLTAPEPFGLIEHLSESPDERREQILTLCAILAIIEAYSE